jgi:GNAT superfamily N-acetyltransferase
VQITLGDDVGRDEASWLYEAAGWTAYTRDPDALARAIAQSHLVVTARDDDGRLVGLARTISDGVTICYLQDLLVHPDRQRGGIGRALLTRVLGEYADVRQFVLMTDRDGPQDFYRAAGLVPFEAQGVVGFARR